MIRSTRPFPIACLAALAVAFGCASTPEPTPDAPRPPADAVADTAPKAEIQPQAPGAPTLAPIYFETDRALLREDARKTLKGHAQLIQQHPEWGLVVIEGHCDERGSEEYNLALGGRRAAAVARYLVDLGVPNARLGTRSYGEARPVIAGHDESAWERNRRSELKTEAQDEAMR
jgi:peptidoglycan-associated lipoprotein